MGIICFFFYFSFFSFLTLYKYTFKHRSHTLKKSYISFRELKFFTIIFQLCITETSFLSDVITNEFIHGKTNAPSKYTNYEERTYIKSITEHEVGCL